MARAHNISVFLIALIKLFYIDMLIFSNINIMFIGVKYWTYCFVNIFENPNLILKIVGFTSCE